MNSDVLTVIFKGDCLPLASLRLLVPPIQLMSACMWQFLKKQDVLNYWKVAEYVSLVMDMVPELLMYKHRMQLNLGLRARYILELCQSDQHMETDFILSQLEKIKATQPSLVDMKGSGEEVAANFLELIQTLLKDPEERRHFFMEIFPAEYGPQYDHDLQTLFSEFLFRLNQLLPVPDLEQTVSWLGAESDMLDDCLSVSEPTVLIDLLQHHKHLGHLEQHGPPSSMGDTILSSLSAVLPSREMKLAPEQHDKPGPLQVLSDDAHTVMFEDRVAVEIVTVTDYAEVELGTDIELVMGENCCEGTETITVVGDSVVMLPVEMTTGIDVEASEEEPASIILQGANNDDSSSFLYKMPVGPHDCPDCQKKFKFASSLMAHRVIHTGERPHRCNYCGRCFSFRQSLDRHRYTHRSGRQYTCIICGENFNSLSARTDHKQTHMKDGVYTCCQCSTKFKWELALARHLKCHNDDYNANKLTESHKQGEEVVLGDQTDGEAPVVLTNPDSEVEDKDDPEYVEVHSSEHPTSELKGMAPELQNEVISLVKVRTSGRKRKPTMKIQLINLQKSMTTKRRKIRETAAPELEHSLISCAEHSYGSSVVSSEQGDESSAADGSTTAFSCPMCSFHHSEEAQIQHHIDKLHSVEFQDEKLSLQPFVDEKGRFSCPDCNKSFKFQSILKAHQRIHTGEQPFLCSQCGRRFSFKQSLDRHKQTHKSGRKYECLICGEFFKSLVAQREHKSIHMENGDYVCSECGRAFTWKSALVRHLKIHCKGDEDNMESSYKCPYCDQSFSCASYLNKHLLTHQEERVHTCNCGKSFTYRAALTAHQRIHLKERPHTCKQCGKGFLYKGGLLSHTMTHSEDMPFMCSFCGKSFKRERSMKKHEHCHTRENVFSCSQCDKSFVYKATLIRHELTHSGERPYLCSDCGKGFYSHAELLKHERFHTGHKPFQCPHCGKKFTQSCYLTIHLRYHTGVRPYSCTECDKRFLSANRLKRHQRTHSGEKPYLCVECGKGFRQAYNLKMHQRTHTMKLT